MPVPSPVGSFNSKLVRLKDGEMCPHWPGDEYEFQFQTGAIKRNADVDNPVKIARFNSKLVRLKVLGALSLRACALFQFQTGAIKSDAPLPASNPRKASFNSKLVRLKAGRGVALDVHSNTGFNSKLVRLKAGNAKLGNVGFRVSIPNWCD